MAQVGERSAAEILRWHYENRHDAALNAHRQGRSVLGMTSNTVPRELIAAAGFFPLLLSPREPPLDELEESASSPAPHAVYMEEVFDPRTRAIFDFLVSGQGAFLRGVLLPRTSEREHKLFLYLKEIARQEQLQALPEVHLYNLLHSRSGESRAYSIERTRELARWLGALAGREIGEESLLAEIKANNQARQAARRLLQFREAPEPKLSGSEAMGLLGARFFMEATDYARAATRAQEEIERRPSLPGPHILIQGCPLDHPFLHQEIESHGAIVFAEDDWWGLRGITADVALDGDRLEAIAEHYHAEEISPRVLPLAETDEWFFSKAPRANGVVFYHPPDDDVPGWDYPRRRTFLQRIGVPHALVRVEASAFAQGTAPSADPRVSESRQLLADFVASLAKRREG